MDIEVMRLEIAKMECRPGDIVAVKCPERWNPYQIEKFADYVRTSNLFHDLKFMFLPFDMDIVSIITPPAPTRDPFAAPTISRDHRGI